MPRVLCPKCKTVSEVSTSQLMTAPVHLLFLSYMRCPSCGEKAWLKTVGKDTEGAKPKA